MASHDPDRVSKPDLTQSRKPKPLLQQRGTLSSYSLAQMGGCITGDGGRQFYFSASDAVRAVDLVVGHAVSFMHVGEIAFDVASVEGAGVITPRPLLRGTVYSYELESGSGWILGDNNHRYIFSAAEVIVGTLIAAGSSVSFSAAGRVASQVGFAAPLALTTVLIQPSAAAVTQPAVPPKARPREPVARTPVPAFVPIPERPAAKPVRRSRGRRRLYAVAAVSVLLLAGLAVMLLPRGTEPTRDPPLWVQASPAPLPAAAALVEVSTSDILAALVPESGLDVFATLPALRIEPTPEARPQKTQLAVSQSAPKPLPAPVRAKQARPPSAPTALEWWPAQRRGNLNLIYAGSLADRPAIVLMFDSRFRDAQSANSHVEVRRMDGSRVAGKWAVATNSRMLILPVPPGSYTVALGPELAEPGGAAIGIAVSGPVVVR